MRILIVEDSFINRKYLVKLLSPFGECDIAVNGQEGVDAFKAMLEGNQPYDLICLDIMMPEMDGMQALTLVRQIEAERDIMGLDGVKVIMTTATDKSENILGSFRTGCEGYLIKPISKQKLYSMLEKLSLIPANAVGQHG